MQMTDGEIVKSFKDASSKKSQIIILSELNCCSREEIREILVKNGISEEDIPKGGAGRPKKEKTPVKKNETVKEECEDTEFEPLTQKQEEQQERALLIPRAVRVACMEKVDFITQQIIILENERDSINDFLKGMVVK